MENIKIILKNSSYYPKTLFKLKTIPEFLFAVGNLDLLKTFCIGIVGARACEEDSIFLTKQLVNELSSRNITILSGMADGIDQIAHEACLDVNGKTIAIIGSGFNTIKNKSLFGKILEHDGLILSEYFPDIPAFKYNYPRRNQLLVALSKGIVAVETHKKSGTMITAKEALFQKIPLFTFPGSISDIKYAGNNLLLTKGAICINSYKDVINNLKTIYPNFYTSSIKNIKAKNQILISKEFKEIYSTLKKAPQDINSIIKKCNYSLQEAQSKLILMELDGLVRKCRDGTWKVI